MLPHRTAYVFGGTLDPIHEGHVGVLREVLAPGRVVVVAPTLQNPWKVEQPTPIELRREMIAYVVRWERLPLSDPVPEEGLCISDIDYIYVADFVKRWRERFSGKIHWVVGPDVSTQATSWRDWDKLDIELYVAKTYAGDLHAREVRAGRAALHPAIRELAKANGLYGPR